MRRAYLCLVLLLFAGCSGPQEIPAEDFGQWTTGDGVRFNLRTHGCGVGTTNELLPENVNFCGVMFWLKSSEALTFSAEDQLFTYGETEVAAYGITLSRDPAAINSQGPRPAPGEAPEVVSMGQGDQAVINMYVQLPENQEPDTFILDPGNGTTYLFNLSL